MGIVNKCSTNQAGHYFKMYMEYLNNNLMFSEIFSKDNNMVFKLTSMLLKFRVRQYLLGKFQPIFILFMFVTALQDKNAFIDKCLTSNNRCTQKGSSLVVLY